MKTPMQESLKKLRDEGWHCEIVEFWNPFSKTKKDLFGFGDILCIRGEEIMLVQTTDHTNITHRMKKIADSEHLAKVRGAKIVVAVHGWNKEKKTCRVELM